MNSNLFDTSAIINLCSMKKVEILQHGATLGLTYYEIGNVMWKQVHLNKVYSLEEGEKVLDAFNSVLQGMQVIQDNRAIETLRLAARYNLTFYDAAFLDTAMTHNFSLVTDDKKLGRVAEKHIPVRASTEL
ncbi:MAG: type II toxin-antitoxin system VapC family toxin [Candidatus Ranarchaeia archaeon]